MVIKRLKMIDNNTSDLGIFYKGERSGEFKLKFQKTETFRGRDNTEG